MALKKRYLSNKIGRPTPQEIDLRERERAFDAIVSSLPTLEPSDSETHAATTFAQSPIHLKRAVWLKFCGYSSESIARDLNYSPETVRRFLRSDMFTRTYEAERGAMLARVDDALTERLQELALESLALKVRLMRNPRTNRFLRNKIAGEILDLAMTRGAGGKAKRPSDLLKAMYEEARRVVGPNGEVVTKTFRITGNAPADVLPGGGHDPGGSGGTAEVDGGAGSMGGEAGAGEDEASAGGDRNHSGPDTGGIRALPEPTS